MERLLFSNRNWQIHCRNNTSTANQPPQLLTNMAISYQPKLQQQKNKKTTQIEQIATKPIPFHSIRSNPNPNSTSPTWIKIGFHRLQQAWSSWTFRRRTSPSRTSLIARTLIFMASPSLAPSSTSPPSPIPLFFLW